MNSPKNPSFSIKTLGCKVNQYESQLMRECLLREGFTEKEEAVSDYYIVNSCTVTHRADRDTRHLIHHCKKINPKAKIIVTGCYAEKDEDRNFLKSIPGVSYLVRNTEKEKVAEIITGNHKPERATYIKSFKDRDRAFIKVQDGCNNTCSYCKVRIVRGRSKSRRVEDIINEIEALLERDYKEIVLTGICLGSWGKDIGRGKNLVSLLEEVTKLKGDFRVRLSSIEPMYINNSLIRKVASDEKICKHFHIPLQSGDSRILRLMKRPYRSQDFKKIITNIRKTMPDAAFTTDVLLGFPGESGWRFHKTHHFLKTIKPSRMHIFSYSRRPGTPAYNLPGITEKSVVKRRVEILSELNKKLMASYAKSLIRKPAKALIESQRDKKTSLLTGYTDRYVHVLLDGPDSLKGQIVRIEIIDIKEESPIARVL